MLHSMLLPPLLLASLITTTPDGGIVTVKGRQLLAEVARTEKERERGLAYRSSFKPERCLFVVPGHEGPNPVRTAKFLLPFDVVWIDAEGTVVEVAKRVPPCKTGTDCPEHGGTTLSSYYVFLAAGTVQRLRIRLGDKVQWDLHFSDGTNLRNGPHVHTQQKGKRP